MAWRLRVTEPTTSPWGTALAILRLILPESGKNARASWRSARARGARAGDRFSQQQLAQAAGMSPSAISRYESGERTPSPEQVCRLVEALGYPRYVVERTLSFVSWARGTRGSATANQDRGIAAHLDTLAGEAGLWIEELVRDVLAAALLDAPGSDSIAPSPPAAAIPVVASGTSHRRRPEAPAETTAAGETAAEGPPVGDALTMLRLIRGWERLGLAQAAGLSLAAITRYEHRKARPSLARLRRILAALDFPAGVYDRCLHFITSTLDARRFHLSTDPADAWKVAARAIAAQQARAAETFARSKLTGLVTVVRVVASRRDAPATWDLLQDCPEPVRLGLIREVPEFQTVGLCELLCERSLEAAGASAAEAIRRAELAVEVARQVAGTDGFRSRVLGYAGIHLANGLRVAGSLPEADESLASFLALWHAGTAEDPGLLNAARVLGIEASLRRAQRRLPEALDLIDQALAIDVWGETPALQLAKARALAEIGQFEASLAILQHAVHQIDASRKPRRRYVALNLLVLNLCHLGRYAAAEMLLPEARKQASSLGNRLDLLRIDWLAGKVAAGLGRADEAVALLMRLREQFLATDNAYDFALVTLELAEVHAALGRTTEVKALARQSAPFFAGQGVHREAQQALALFCRATEDDRLTAELLRSLVTFLCRARYDTHLRFDNGT
jgi:transcriptional regulator with XRE-family HTH domain/tetratricopeptide (TPR) repeat protein